MLSEATSVQDLHKEAETFFMNKFGGARCDKEGIGDFQIRFNKRVIVFEVYTPEEPISRSTWTLKKESADTRITGNRVIHSLSGGLDPQRLNQLIERVLEEKAHQFNGKVKWPKILIVCLCYPKSFAGLDNFWISVPIKGKLLAKYKKCSAIFIYGNFARNIVSNPSAVYKLETGELTELSNILLKDVSRTRLIH